MPRRADFFLMLCGWWQGFRFWERARLDCMRGDAIAVRTNGGYHVGDPHAHTHTHTHTGTTHIFLKNLKKFWDA